jgi:hypothetical protein
MGADMLLFLVFGYDWIATPKASWKNPVLLQHVYAELLHDIALILHVFPDQQRDCWRVWNKESFFILQKQDQDQDMTSSIKRIEDIHDRLHTVQAGQSTVLTL